MATKGSTTSTRQRRGVERLSELTVRTTKPGIYSDGRGLSLVVEAIDKLESDADAKRRLEAIAATLASGKKVDPNERLRPVTVRRRWVFRYTSPVTGKRREMAWARPATAG